MFIIEKYIKIRFKNKGSPCYFLSSRGQKIKNVTKIEQRRLFLFTFFIHFLWHFLCRNWLTQYLIHFCVWLIFEQDLTNLLILEVYAKIDLNVHVFDKKNWCSSKSDQWFCDSHTLTVRATFRSEDFRWKKNMGVWGYFLKKRKVCMQNLTKERKQPPVVILQQGIFYNIFILCLWLRII